MKSVKLFGAVVAGFVLLAFTPVLAGTVGDDFNDNAKDTAKWGSDDSFGSSATLLEANGHLQFGGNSPSVDIRAGIVRPWIYSYGSYTSNWEVSADVHVGALSLQQNDEIEMFLAVVPPDRVVYENNFTVNLDLGSDSQGSYRGYYSSMQMNGTEVGNEDWVDTTNLQGRVSIRFDATTKVLSSYYNGTPLGSNAVPSGWGMTESSTFRFAVGGSLGSSSDSEPFTGMSYSGTDVYADNFTVTDTGLLPETGISPEDELAIRNGFAAAIEAYNAQNSELFAARISDAYLNDGDTKMSLIADMLSPDWQPMSYTMDAPLPAGAGLATAVIHWGTGEIELQTFRKEGDTWLLYGDQSKYPVMFFTSHSAGSYTLVSRVEDPSNNISSVEVFGPGLTNTISLNYKSGSEYELPSWVSWSVGASTSNLFPQFGYINRPAIGAEYTLTIHETTSNIVTQTLRITGYVENFATNLSPAAGSTITNAHPVFSWSDGGFWSRVQLNIVPSEGPHRYIWDSGELASSPLTYNGPELQSGTNYCLHFRLLDGWENSSDIEVPFLYQVAVPTKIIGLSGNLSFGSVVTGQPSTATLTITNSGNTTLTVTNITYPTCFSGAWSGTVAAGKATNVTVTFAPVAVTNYSGTVTVNSDKTSGTNTISVLGTGTDDGDGNGLPDWWELQHFGGTGVNPNAVCSNRVNTVIQAYVAGLNPTNSSARFGITNHSRNLIQWNAVSGRVYNVYWSTNLMNGFQTLQTNYTGGAITDSVRSAASKCFYKIDVRMSE